MNTVPVEIVDEPKVGTATWMIPPKVKETFPYSEGAIWLGRNGDDARTPVGRKDESHVLLCAMNRSAKGRAIITNNLLLWPGSVFCNDPKGENASVTAARRGQGSKHATKFLGQKVCVLDSHRTAKVEDRYRAYYNVLDDLDPESSSTPARAENIVRSFFTDAAKKDPTWDELAIAYMKALLLHIITAPVSKEENDSLIPAKERDLITFRRMILTGDFYRIRALEARVPPEELKKKPPQGHELLLKRMERNPAFGGIIADEAKNQLDNLKTQPKLWNSLRVSAGSATAWIDDPEIREVLRAGTYPNTFKASDLETDPKGVSIYVCLKLEDQTRLAAWPRLLTNMVLSAAQTDYFRSPASGHNTHMMLDEFAALERMKSIENAAPAIAGAGIKLFMVLQNLSQMKFVYGENFEAFMANAGTHIYYGFNDNFTAEYVKKRLGEIEVIRHMKQGSTATGSGTSTSNVEGGGTSEGTSSGTTKGWSPSLFHLSLFTSKQRAKNTNTGTNESWSRAVAEQESKTSTEGWQQQLHKKPLADIHELMQLFGTIDDEAEPNFPGIGLISTAEKAPVLIQKTFYDRDVLFEGMFDPHPKHGFIPYSEVQVFSPPTQKVEFEMGKKDLRKYAVRVEKNYAVDIDKVINSAAPFAYLIFDGTAERYLEYPLYSPVDYISQRSPNSVTFELEMLESTPPEWAEKMSSALESAALKLIEISKVTGEIDDLKHEESGQYLGESLISDVSNFFRATLNSARRRELRGQIEEKQNVRNRMRRELVSSMKSWYSSEYYSDFSKKIEVSGYDNKDDLNKAYEDAYPNR